MRRWPIAVLLFTAACTAMALRKRPFVEPKDEPRTARLRSQARVILITLDGPLRDDVLSGPHMPGLQQAIRVGGIGFAAEASSAMALSLPGYQAMAAGTLTGCIDNDCPRIEQETMAERVARSLELRENDVAVFASWSRLARAASSHDGTVFVDAPDDSPARDGGPPWRNARFDDETFSRARKHWETNHPRFLHLAFLDTDEWAHQGLHAEYEQSLRETDARIVEVLGWVAALPPEEAAVTTVLLTSDHGRARNDWTRHGPFDPGSGEIFVAAIGPMVKRGEPGAVDQRDLRPTVERLFGLCPAHVDDDGRAIDVIAGDLPCR